MKTLSASDLKFIENQLLGLQGTGENHNKTGLKKLNQVISKVRAVHKFEKIKKAKIAPGEKYYFKEVKMKPLSIDYSQDELFRFCRIKMRVTSNVNFEIRCLAITNIIAEFQKFKKAIKLKISDCHTSQIDDLKMKVRIMDGCISYLKERQVVKMPCDFQPAEPYYYIPKAITYEQNNCSL